MHEKSHLKIFKFNCANNDGSTYNDAYSKVLFNGQTIKKMKIINFLGESINNNKDDNEMLLLLVT